MSSAQALNGPELIVTAILRKNAGLWVWKPDRFEQEKSPNVEFGLQKHSETMQTRGQQANLTQNSKACWTDFYTQKK